MICRTSFLFSIILLFIRIENVIAVCCNNTGWFSCCGKSDCNVFCCNCDGDGCRPSCSFNPSLALTITKFSLHYFFGRRKRDTVQSSISTWQRFTSIDKDQNGFLDFEESILWITRGKPMAQTNPAIYPTSANRTGLPSWFTSMDRDGNSLLSPNEFDNELG